MIDDYGLLHQAAEQDSPPTAIADAFYDGYKGLPDALRAKLSLHDLKCIYETMVHPVIWVVTDMLTPDESAKEKEQPSPSLGELVAALKASQQTIEWMDEHSKPRFTGRAGDSIDERKKKNKELLKKYVD
jgi:hypothetical protein